MKLTPLTEKHRQYGARLIPFAGFLMPVEYSGIINEHLTVRKHAGLFDVSHMGEFRITGTGALDFLQKLTINDVASLKPGQIHYTCFPNGKGGIVDDLLIYKKSTTDFFLVVNASNIQKDWDWLWSNTSERVTIENLSEQMAQVALQGPASDAILSVLSSTDLNQIKYYHFVECTVAGIHPVLISRTGYTGEPGFEIYFENKHADTIWDALMDAGKKYGIVPIGLGARDTLRLEAGMCLYGNDIDDTTSPLEAGMDRFIKFNVKEFIDKEYLLKQKEKGLTRRLSGFIMSEKGIPRHSYPICDESEKPVGIVTSGSFSPVLNTGIGMGYIPPAMAKPGNPLYIKIRDRLLKAHVTALPFIQMKPTCKASLNTNTDEN